MTAEPDVDYLTPKFITVMGDHDGHARWVAPIDCTDVMSAYRQGGVHLLVTLDQEGVGELVKIAAERGRKTRPDIKLGICGEHGGDPASIHFCEGAGLDYVSCSPFRVPIARLAAAQAALGRAAASTA